MPDTLEILQKPVLVLGASGFIGSRVVAALSADPRYRPIAASRHSDLTLDATDAGAVREAMNGVAFVINCIAGSPGAMVKSTQALCDAARSVPPRRIVHLSSMAVYGAATGTVREDQPPVIPISGYGQIKIQCEDIIRKYVEDGGDAVILRPTCVFGPGSPQWTTRMVRLLRAGRIGDLGVAGDGCCNLAFINDVVSAIVSALDRPGIRGQTFNLSSAADLSWNEFLIALGKQIGATPIRRISSRQLRMETKLLAPLRRIAAMAVRSHATEAITPSLAALWRQDIRIDCAAARSALALHQTSTEDMITAVTRDDRLMKELA
jgi:nucleoside-diphosphate-sugar epimerase